VKKKRHRGTRERECPLKQVVGLQQNQEEDLQPSIHALIPLGDLVVDVGHRWETGDVRPLGGWEEMDRRSVENQEMQDVVPFHLFHHLRFHLRFHLLPLLLKIAERGNRLPFHLEGRGCAVPGVWRRQVEEVEVENAVKKKKKNRLQQMPKKEKGMRSHWSLGQEGRCEIQHYLLHHLLGGQKSCHQSLVDACQRVSWRR